MPEVNGVEVGTTELDKLSAVHEQSEEVGRFLDWLEAQGVRLCKWVDEQREDIGPCTECEVTGKQGSLGVCQRCWGKRRDVVYTPAGFYLATAPHHMGLQGWLYAFYEIDPNKVDDERRALLNALSARPPQ